MISKHKYIVLILLLLPQIIFATSSIRDKEMLGYIRVLLSDDIVSQKFSRALTNGYIWHEEHGNFGSMSDNETFPGQIRIKFKKISKNKKQQKTLTINFIWSRKTRKIIEIKSVYLD
ncbi:MAG: hypothetical protein GY714_17850 [Desulfobacterales bacterium]|nr:hypothetical protein [Desulfobacterales bacterium]MCP4163163.1 hypothetical protein [Deltaproteobacteria bacterium]